MRHTRIGLFAAFCLAVVGLGRAQEKVEPRGATTTEKAASAADRWEKTIAAFEAEDRASPPLKNAVVFIGSSSIRFWDLKASFPDVAAINRGFGGSQMVDAARYVRRIVTPYNPRLIVLYEGDNDLNAGKSPQQVAADFDEFLKSVRSELATTPLIVIGLKPSLSRWKLIEQQREANRLLASRCAQDGNCQFLDVEKPMLGSDGQPKPHIFRADKLHLNDEGYKIWTELLRPLLTGG